MTISCTRSIPTGMGKPAAIWQIKPFSMVYPHGYGETVIAVYGAHFSEGLSPRVWGNQILDSVCGHVLGSIPTGMGKPQMECQSIRFCQVYPHGYGETGCRFAPAAGSLGLSPRVWGNLGKISDQAGEPRSIPTGMGKPI